MSGGEGRTVHALALERMARRAGGLERAYRLASRATADRRAYMHLERALRSYQRALTAGFAQCEQHLRAFTRHLESV